MPLDSTRSGYIYLITHVPSGRSYVGSSVQPEKRWNLHRLLLRRGTHHSARLQAVVVTDGLEALRFQRVEYVADAAYLAQRELWWMRAFDTLHRDTGFNRFRPMTWRARTPRPEALGPMHPNWKGTAVQPGGARDRIVRYNPLKGRVCCECERRPARVRVPWDGDVFNFLPTNILVLCYPCQHRLNGSVATLAARRREITHCQRGHPFSGTNLIVSASGHRSCRDCRLASYRRYHRQHPRPGRPQKPTPQEVTAAALALVQGRTSIKWLALTYGVDHKTMKRRLLEHPISRDYLAQSYRPVRVKRLSASH